MKTNVFKDKKVLVTGHTGFKGSWLAAWLYELGADVYGLSLDVPTNPSHYSLFNQQVLNEEFIDISDQEKVKGFIDDVEPDFLFHLAAQPIVLDSYENPLNTFLTNSIGTANVLDALRVINKNCVAVMITSDKCYDNQELTRGYLEEDRLGGKDPYSGSKGAAELIIKSYTESFFKKEESNVRVAVGRAGNVIGGGDWAPHRIIPDCIRAWSEDRVSEIRNPFSTRPWQHVLEPLGGYLRLAEYLNNDKSLNGQTFNFGPSGDSDFTVGELVEAISKAWEGSSWSDVGNKNDAHYEAGLLKLNCEKAEKELSWKSVLTFEETALWTGDWYYKYYKKSKDEALDFTSKQILEYMKLTSTRL